MSQSSFSSNSSRSLRKQRRVVPPSKATKSKEPTPLHKEDRPSQDVLLRLREVGRYESALLYGYLEHRKHFYSQSAFKIGLVRNWRFAFVSQHLMLKLPSEHWPQVRADGLPTIICDEHTRQHHPLVRGSVIFPFLLRDATNGKLLRVNIFALICANLPLPLMIGEDSYLGRQLARSYGQGSCVLSSSETDTTATVKLMRQK